MYQVKVSNAGEYLFDVKTKNYDFKADMKGLAGATPPDVLLASLATCVGVYLRKYAEGSKIGLTSFEISCQAEFSQEPPACFKKIEVNVDLKGAQLDERRIKAMLEFMKNCPVHNTLKSNPHIDIRVV